ncbi:hypothetical protein Gpo141_00009123 [Globisporangium polare]
MARTTQEAIDQSVPTSAVVLGNTPEEIRDTAQFPPVLRQMDVNPEALVFIQEHVAQQQPMEEQDAFFVVDLSAVRARVETWTRLLPRIEPFYAVKCNPDAQILQLLTQLGCGFDCASRAEIEDVLRSGAEPRNVIYANPCKQASHIAFAAANSVHMMTFDSVEELDKIHKIDPLAQVVLRLYVDDTKSMMRLGAKFGALVDDAQSLFAHAQKLGLAVIGVSFHVGSGCLSVSAYADAVRSARKAFDIGASLGFKFSLLDVGGGFPSIDGDPIFFRDCAQELSTSLDLHFPASSNESTGGERVRIIAEPGRFFVASSLTLALNVIGRKVSPLDKMQVPELSSSSPSRVPHYMYFVNDGIYGSFNGLLNDHPTIQPVVMLPSSNSPVEPDQEADDNESQASLLHPASIWGPTCDGTDCVLKDVQMPVLEIGDWIVFPGMGAYTCASSTSFNGFAPPKKVYMQQRNKK